MTALQDLDDQILGLQAQWLGKRMERAYAVGERDTARHLQREMYDAIRRRREFRIASSKAAPCNFVGERDKARDGRPA